MDKWSTYLHKIYFFFVKKFRPPFFSKKYDVTISLKVTYHELQVLLILFVFSSIILSEISIKWCPGFTFHKLPKKIDENVCYFFYFKVSQRMLCNSKKQKKKKKIQIKRNAPSRFGQQSNGFTRGIFEGHTTMHSWLGTCQVVYTPYEVEKRSRV